jgi:copper homeostasis protein
LSTGKFIFELICLTPEDCVAAEKGGAGRIELCSAIELGGLTPSFGLTKNCLSATRLSIMAMVRPRTGGFCYSKSEFETMLVDVEQFKSLGVAGIVFGILNSKRRIDLDRCRKVLEAANGLETVFHRAFDATADAERSLEELIELGLKRVLTSGQRQTAVEGRELIRRLVDRAAGRIQILPGSGLRSGNVLDFISATGVDQIHLTAFDTNEDLSMTGVPIRFNGREPSESKFRAVSEQNVREIASRLL